MLVAWVGVSQNPGGLGGQLRWGLVLPSGSWQSGQANPLAISSWSGTFRTARNGGLSRHTMCMRMHVCMYACCVHVCIPVRIHTYMHVCIQMREWLVDSIGAERMKTFSGQPAEERVLHVRYLGQASATGHRQLCITITDQDLGQHVLNLLWSLWVPTTAELSRDQAADSENWRYCAVRWMKSRPPQ